MKLAFSLSVLSLLAVAPSGVARAMATANGQESCLQGFGLTYKEGYKLGYEKVYGWSSEEEQAKRLLCGASENPEFQAGYANGASDALKDIAAHPYVVLRDTDVLSRVKADDVIAFGGGFWLECGDSSYRWRSSFLSNAIERQGAAIQLFETDGNAPDQAAPCADGSVREIPAGARFKITAIESSTSRRALLGTWLIPLSVDLTEVVIWAHPLKEDGSEDRSRALALQVRGFDRSGRIAPLRAQFDWAFWFEQRIRPR